MKWKEKHSPPASKSKIPSTPCIPAGVSRTETFFTHTVLFLTRRVLFQKCDMSNWESVVDFFKKTWEAFGAIDVVLANAGIHSEKTWLADALRVSEELVHPDMNTMRVNLDGMVYMTQCAIHYFARRPEVKTQLVFTGSAASFLDTPPLYQYCASKAGVLGLMRSLRTDIPRITKGQTTVNMVAPWQTSMTSERFLEIWGDLPSNSTQGVGKALLLPALRPGLNGLSLLVHGDQITDLEESLAATMPQWMGQELSEEVREGQRRILGVEKW
ncbi:hypothetical protein LTS17_000933 [Exophiala oligosperma]